MQKICHCEERSDAAPDSYRDASHVTLSLSKGILRDCFVSRNDNKYFTEALNFKASLVQLYQMTKAGLRKLYTEKRNALSAAEYATLNLQLTEQFKAINLSKVKCLHIFLPIAERKEPDTWPIIKWLEVTHPQIKIVFPKTNFADNTMQSFANDEHLQLAVNDHGITEPVSGTLVGDEEIDIVILPLLAFDQQGYRVGYGKGFYDRFITKCRADVELTGLSFFEPVDEISDVNIYDKKMQFCVTPSTLYGF